MTGIMSIPPLVLASIVRYVGAHHLANYWRVRRSRVHVTSALLSLAISGYSLCAAGLYNAASPEEGRRWIIGRMAFLLLGAPAMMFFFADRTGTSRRGFNGITSAGFAAVALAAFIGGSTLICSHVPAVKHAALPLGLSAIYQEVKTGPDVAPIK